MPSASCFLVGEGGRLLDLDAGAAALVGRKKQALLGSSFFDLPMLDEAGLLCVLRMVERVLREDRVEVRDLVLRGGDGQQLAAHLCCSLVSAAGGRAVLCVVSLADSNTALEALRDSEARYRDLLEEVHDLIYEVAADGELVFVSTAVRRYGWEPQELIGRRFDGLVHVEDRQKLMENLSAQRPASAFRFITRAGELRWGRTQSKPVILEGGRQGLRGVLLDITDLVWAEERFRQAQKMEAIGRLASGVAHEFNNMLAIIRTCSGLLLEQLHASDPTHGDISLIAEAAERAAGLTRQLQTFGRQRQLQPRQLDLNALLLRMSAMVRHMIGEGIELLTELAPGLPPVHADPDQLEQVVLNLALAARGALPEGGRLRFRTSLVVADDSVVGRHAELSAGTWVQLEARDDGEGIDDAILPRVFEPFIAEDESLPGSGLALACVYGIVKQSGGEARVESRPGEGTTYRIYLPASGQTESGDEVAGEALLVRGGSETLMVVEDEEVLGRTLANSLERQGYRVLCASDGEEALRLLEQNPGQVDLLLADLVMPCMGGASLAQHLAENVVDVKVLFMTGYPVSDFAAHASVDAAAVLQKPFETTTLFRSVRQALDRD